MQNFGEETSWKGNENEMGDNIKSDLRELDCEKGK
jgi:hypothetical protein